MTEEDSELYDDKKLSVGLFDTFEEDFLCEDCKNKVIVTDEMECGGKPLRAIASRVARCHDCMVMYKLEPIEYIVLKSGIED